MLSMLRDAYLEIRTSLGKTLLSAVAICVGVTATVGIAVEASFSDAAVRARSEQERGRELTLGANIEPTRITGERAMEIAQTLDSRIGSSDTTGWYASIDIASQVTVMSPTRRVLTGAHVNLIVGPIGAVRRLIVIAGSNAPDLHVGRPQTYINRAAAEALGWPQAVLLRNPTKTSSITFDVQAVVDDGDAGPKVYADMAAYSQYDETIPSHELLTIFVTSSSRTAETISVALEQAITRLGLAPSAPIARVDGIGELDLGRSSVQRGFSIASLIVFAVAALGTANVGLSSVRERRREYAIRRAVGFTQKRIGATVVAAHLGVGFAASIFAVLISILLARGVIPGLSTSPLVERPPFPWSAAMLGVAAGCSSALIGAAAPAIAAARTSIALALR